MKGKIKQICVLVDDVQKAMKEYWEKFGIGPWDIRHFTPDTVHDLYAVSYTHLDVYKRQSQLSMV